MPQLQLPLLLLFLLLSVFLLYTNLHSIVENFTDQLCLRNDVLLDSWYFGYILWLRRLSMQEWYEYAHLEHVQEFLVKRFSNHIAEGHRSVVENFNFVLVDQE